MAEYIFQILSTSAVVSVLVAIVGFLSKSLILERLKRAVRHEYETKLKILENDLNRKTEIELSKLNNTLAMQIEIAKIKLGPYSEKQFAEYNELWASLCELKWSMLDLWNDASEQNLKKFSSQLFDTHVKLEKSALIFEENHFQQLMKCLNIFADYEMGKKTLIEYRNNRNSIPDVFEIQQMVNENRQEKKDLLSLLPNIRTTLRQQIGFSRDAEQVIAH